MSSNLRDSDPSCLEMLRNIIRINSDESSGFVEVFVDFENAKPSDDEWETFEMAESVLSDCESILNDISSYGSGGYSLRTRIKNDSDIQALKDLMKQLEPYVARTVKYYEHIQKVERIVPVLLWQLCSGTLPLEEQLARKQSTTRQFSRLISFVLDFDVHKMSAAEITNDYSYYRRANHIIYQDFEHNKNEFPRIQKFLCEGHPMLRALCNGVDSFMASHSSPENTTNLFVSIINICRFMLSKDETLSRLSDPHRNFCCRIMTGLVILFDHLDPNGAFASPSRIDVRDVVKLIRIHSNQSDFLLGGLRFTTKHFNDAPKSLRTIIEQQGN